MSEHLNEALQMVENNPVGQFISCAIMGSKPWLPRAAKTQWKTAQCLQDSRLVMLRGSGEVHINAAPECSKLGGRGIMGWVREGKGSLGKDWGRTGIGEGRGEFQQYSI